jgi:hypothetical protein
MTMTMTMTYFNEYWLIHFWLKLYLSANLVGICIVLIELFILPQCGIRGGIYKVFNDLNGGLYKLCDGVAILYGVVLFICVCLFLLVGGVVFDVIFVGYMTCCTCCTVG